MVSGALRDSPSWGIHPAYLKLRLVNKGDKTYHRGYQAFLKRLIKARKDAGLLQAEVSARMGKAHSFVSKCELGERRVDVIELQKLARIYDKSIAYFLGEE
jgi:ribosome-binding protein aMBF1 (putative translation factor)